MKLIEESLLYDPYVKAEINNNSIRARLHAVYTTFADDEWLPYINNWRIESSEAAVIRIRTHMVADPYKFYESETWQKEPILPNAGKFAEMANLFRAKNRKVARLLLDAARELEGTKKKKKRKSGSSDIPQADASQESKIVRGQDQNIQTGDSTSG